MDAPHFLPNTRITLITALDAFRLIELPARAASEATIRGYIHDLRSWMGVQRATYVDELDKVAMTSYLAGLERRALKAASRRRKIAALRTFLAYLQAHGVLKRTLARHCLFPKVEQTPRRLLELAQIETMLAAAKISSARDHALLALCLFAGVRLQQLSGFLSGQGVAGMAEPSDCIFAGDGLYR